MIICTEDILVMMEEPERFLREELRRCSPSKENSIGSPGKRLRNKVSQFALENGVNCWSFSSSQHAQAATKNVECYRSRVDLGPLSKSKSTWPSNYRIEADVTPEISPLKALHCQSLIGVLRCVFEL